MKMSFSKIKKIISVIFIFIVILGVVGLFAGVMRKSNSDTSGSSNVVEACKHLHIITERENEVEASCTKPGSFDNVVYCTDCAEEIKRETIIVEALGHNEVTDTAVQATCIETGLTEGKHCSVCNEVLVAQTIIEALGHNEVTDAAVQATCIETGLTEGKHCSVCNEVFVTQITLPIITHTYDNDTDENCNICGFARDISCNHSETVVIESVEAGCITSGLTEGKKCALCNELIIAQTLVSPYGHMSNILSRIEPTCIETGLTEGENCLVCGIILVPQTVIPTIDHNPGVAIVENELVSTCTTPGYYDKVFRCTVCDYEISRERFVIAQLDHIIVTLYENEVEPTCTREGFVTIVSKCSVCDTEVSRENRIYELRAHDYVNGVCTFCSRLEVESEGLTFTISADNTSYAVSGIGDCSDSELIIPSSYRGLPVTYISPTAFVACTTITSVTIPDTIIEIGKGAFVNCNNLKNVVIGKGVKIMNTGVFSGCEALEKVYFNATCMNDLVSENYTFARAGIASEGIELVIGSNVTRIPGRLFNPINYDPEVSNLTSVIFEENSSCESIGFSAFSYCRHLRYINLPNSLLDIEHGVFSHCSDLPELVLPTSLISIGSNAFEFCLDLTNLVIPESVTSIGSYAFRNCNSLVHVDISCSVDSLPSAVFSGCSGLTSVVVNDNLTLITARAFESCSNLTSIYYIGNESSWDNINIESNNDSFIGATVYYYAETAPTESGNYWHYVDGVVTVWPAVE